MKNTTKYALFGALLALVTPVQAELPDCYKLSTALKEAVAANPEKVLELVAAQVAQNESCACEIVKAAIVASDADKNLVAGIVEAAIESAPSKVRIIGQCAVAVAPDALAEVQAVVTKYASASGDSGMSDEKGGVAEYDDEKGEKSVAQQPTAFSSNPLDFPGQGPVGPTMGGPGGRPLFPTVFPIVTPPSSTRN